MGIKAILKSKSQMIWKWINTGKIPYYFSAAYLVLTSLWVYFSPLSLVAFLLLLSAAGVIYAFPVKAWYKVLLGVILGLVVMPIVGARNIFYLEVIFQIALFSALALGLNVMTGSAGLLDMGYVAYYAIGAYLWGFFGSQQMFLLHSIPGSAPATNAFFLAPNTFYIFLFLGLAAAAIVGILLGLPVLRVRGDYLAIVTLGFGEVIRVLANNLDKPLNLTNGPQGITPIQRPTLPEPLLNFLNSIMTPLVGKPTSLGDFYNLFFYLLSVIIIIAVIYVVTRLDDSKVGRAWAAIKDDELAASSMGVRVVLYKLAAFSVGASFAGIMGVVFAASRTFISPETFNFMQSIGVLSMVILGGLGSIPGVILGATVVVVLNIQVLQGISLSLSSLRQSGTVIPIINFALKDLSAQIDPAKYQKMLFGIILVMMMIYRPNGLIPAKRRKREQQAEKVEIPDTLAESGEA